VEFTLPFDFRSIPYEGLDQIPGYKRYSMLYGPILLAAVGGPLDPRPLPYIFKDGFPEGIGGPDVTYLMPIAQNPSKAREWLKPLTDQPLSFAITGRDDLVFKPYWQVGEKETFTCFPTVELKEQK
jgi:hypothetical protein